MKKILFGILSIIILITCTKDVFEQETEVPTVFFSVQASSSTGGSIDNTGGSVESGSTITITATPEAEYIFTGWTGTSSSENPLTVTINSDLTITANFEKRKYPLIINKVGEGTVKEEIVNTGKSTDYESGTVVKLTAVPSDGYALMRWYNNGVLDTLNPIQIIIDRNKNVDASGHPFYLKTTAGTGTGDTVSGVTNNGTTNQTVTWTPNSAGTYYYQCSLHGGMVGTITIQ